MLSVVALFQYLLQFVGLGYWYVGDVVGEGLLFNNYNYLYEHAYGSGSYKINGILFEPAHKNELAEAMSKVIETPNTLSNLAKEAQRESSKFLAVDKWVSKYVDLYNQLIRK